MDQKFSDRQGWRQLEVESLRLLMKDDELSRQMTNI